MNRTLNAALAAALAVAALPAAASAKTICVNTTGGCDATLATPFSALGSAQAEPDTIKLGPGDYLGPLSYTATGLTTT